MKTHFFYVRVKFWSQIIRNRLFNDMNYQWLCKYGKDWGQSFTVQDCPHIEGCDNVTAECGSCPIMWLLSVSTSLPKHALGMALLPLRITRDRKGTDLQWEMGHAFQCLLCSIPLVSKPYLCQNHVEKLLIYLVNTLTTHLGSAYYTWNCYKPFPNAISFNLLNTFS